jgi:hypothetical protein
VGSKSHDRCDALSRHASAEPGAVISDREGGAEPASKVMKRGLTVPPADITVKLSE